MVLAAVLTAVGFAEGGALAAVVELTLTALAIAKGYDLVKNAFSK